MSRHPADETLAAFADGRLKVDAREEMIEHLASCDDCRSIHELLAGAQDAGVIDPPARVVHGNFGKRALVPLAAAAAAAIVFFTPPVQEQVAAWRTGGVSELVAAAEELRMRDIEGRLAGFPHKELKGVDRSGETQPQIDDTKLPLYALADDIDVDASASPKKMRAAGLLLLLLGQREAAIEKLEEALTAAGGNDPVLLNDLSAAYLEASQWSVPNAAQRALELADRSWTLRHSPEAAWNRAYAYEHLGRDAEALAAWREYLKLDPQSEWADEVRTKRIPYIDAMSQP